MVGTKNLAIYKRKKFLTWGEINVKNQLAKLIDVKSVVTIMLAFVFAVLAVKEQISPEQFLTVFTVVISFYFGTQYQKNCPTDGS